MDDVRGEPVIVPDVGQVELRESQPVIYDQPVRLQLLVEDPETGAEHYVVRYPAGMRARRHRHSAAHTIIVLEGTLRANGQVLGAGGYCHFPAGTPMHHEPAGNDGCLFVTIFHGPFDVEPLEERAARRSPSAS